MIKIAKHHAEQMEKAKDLMDGGPLTDPGFARSLFFGRLRLDKLIPYPTQDADEAARTNEMIARLEHVLDTHVDPDLIDAQEAIPQRAISELGKIGAMGMTVPREYGGGGLSHTAYCRVLERVARTCASTAVFLGAHQSIGLKAVVLNGTEQQKRRWLPELAAGRQIAAFALTEPEAGSDAANVQTRARISDDGETWILDGQKKFITNGAQAGMMTVMARTAIEDNGKTRDKITAFIVTPDMPGFEVVHKNHSKCGIRGTWQATLRFTQMRVPRQNILGEPGRGLKVALTVLDYGRCTLSAGCLGGAKVALDLSVEHVLNRRQFGRTLAEFELTKQKIARMAELTFAMDALTYLCAGLVDRHERDLMLETAICKLFCSEASWHVIDDAVQLFGGEGYMREKGLERMLRDARINRIVEGATEVMTSFVALMGMKGVGEQFEQVIHDLRHPIGNFGRLTSFAGHEWRDVVIGPRVSGLHPRLAAEGRTLARLTRRLARSVSKTLAVHRQRILDQQMLQQRVAWSVIEMVAMAAVISRLQAMLESANGDGSDRTVERDLIVGRGYCRHAAGRIRRRLRGLAVNGDEQRLRVADAVLGM